VLAFDMPHFGRSDKPADRFIDCTWYAQVLAEALKKIGVKKAHFVGNSMGGIISMEMALTEPDMVDQIILMGVPGAISVITVRPTEGEKHLIGYYAGEGPTPAKLEAFIRVMIHDQSRVTPELLEARYKASTAPELMVKRKLESTALINMWRRAHEIPHKTLLVHGRNDRVVPWDAAMALLNLIPNSDLHVFGNCGHWAQWERAQEFNDLALNFFKAPNAG
jgi:pimeloyl-ACP methyl ester carboxylesterase